MWLNLGEKENSYIEMHAHFKVENLSRTMCCMGPVYMCWWSERCGNYIWVCMDIPQIIDVPFTKVPENESFINNKKSIFHYKLGCSQSCYRKVQVSGDVSATVCRYVLRILGHTKFCSNIAVVEWRKGVSTLSKAILWRYRIKLYPWGQSSLSQLSVMSESL